MASWPPYEVLMPLAPWEKPAVLAQALASLAQQQPRPQLLVLSVDGALPTGLLAVLGSYWPLPIRVLCGPGRQGVGLVLARGLEACSCELILRADADDLSLADRAARQLAWMTSHPQVVAASGWIQEFDDESNRLLGCRYVPTGSAVRRWAAFRNPLNHPAVALRRSSVMSVGGYRDCPGFEDYDLWLRLLKRYGDAAVDNLPEVLVRVRVGPAHLERRRGISYARYEAKFLWRSAFEGQMAWSQILILFLFRLPWRLMPSPALACVMRLMRI